MNSLRVLMLPILLSGLAVSAHAGGPLTSGAIASGSVAGPTYTDAWTFSGTAGDRIVVIALTTSGVLNTVSTLKSPGGTTLVSTAGDRWDHQLPNTGTYTLEIADLGLNDAGTYEIAYLNITGGPHTNGGDNDGGAIVSDEVRTGTSGAIADLDAFTFSGTIGHRAVIGVLEGTIAPYNVAFTVYGPNGAGAEYTSSGGNRADFQLGATGTYTIVLEDVGDNDLGSYTLSYLNATAGPFTTAPDLDGGPIVSGSTTTGTLNGVIDFDGFTFSGNAGDRIVVAGLTTSGTMNTLLTLYPPGGLSPTLSTATDRWDYQLPSTGSYTLLVEDQGFGETGTYTLGMINITSGPITNANDADGGAIVSDEVRSGSSTGIADFDAFQFSGAAGQRVIVGVLEGTMSPYNAAFTVYGPNGAGSEYTSSGGNRGDFQLAATGTYTILLEEFGDNDSGNYTLSYVNVTVGPFTTAPDVDGGTIASATTRTGTLNGVVDFDGFTFSGNAGDRIIVAGLTTSGAMNTSLALYPPGGVAPVVSTATDRWDYQLPSGGTYTLLVEDQSFGDTGTYTVGLIDITSGPLTTAGDTDGGPIVSDEVRAGSSSGVADFDAFTFAGTAGQRVIVGVLESTGVPYNAALTVYAPNGGGSEYTSSGGNRADFQLGSTGTYTIVLEDVGQNDSGSYTLSYLNATSGPYTTAPDLDGGALASATPRTGTLNGIVDFDAFTFSGNAGDRIVVAGVTTSGAMNTALTLYPPAGVAPVISSATDRWDYQLPSTGIYTLVMEDLSFGETGSYTLGLLNVTTGPLVAAGDADGGGIASDEWRSGSTSGPADFDAFTFSGASSDRVVFAALATSGATYNTALTIYPPGGGASEQVTSGGDRLDHKLAVSGLYTVVLEDVGDNDLGSYSVTFVNAKQGPATGLDPDGGTISSGDIRNGTISSLPDFDVYWFNAHAGDNAQVQCVMTSGLLNTATYLYPPGGGAAVVATSTDSWSYPITVTGRYSLLVQHSDLTAGGGYELRLNGTLTPLDVPGAPTPTRLALSAPHPNPSRGMLALTLSLPEPGRVEAEVYDLRGGLVRTLADRTFDAGTFALEWDGLDAAGRRAPSGVYHVRLRAGRASFTRRIVRLK